MNFRFIIYITFDRRDANLAFARGSLTRSFVPSRHDVHVLVCLVTLDMTSETRIGVKNKRKENLLFFSEYHKNFISCNENINVNKKKVDPDLIFFTAQRSENISFIFSLVKI